MLKSHDTYLGDVQWFDKVMPLSCRAAWDLLVNSPDSLNYNGSKRDDFPGDEDFKRNQGLFNKGWCVVYLSPHRINVVYNHDGRYSLHTCVLPQKFLEWIEGRACYGMLGDSLTEIAKSLREELGLPQRKP